jgi:uncharacterized membrane protein YbhN (UPF0104 family)
MDSFAATLRGEASTDLGQRLIRVVGWVLGVAAVIGLLDLVGIPVSDWIRDLVHKVRDVPVWAVVAGVVLQTLQTSLAAYAWHTILRAAYPKAEVTFRLVLAAYALAVAMNSFLPANIGTWVMLIMLSSLIAGATLASIISGYAVEKIPFSIFNIAVYVYLFVSVSGSMSINLKVLANHPVLIPLIAVGVIALAVLLTRIFREQWAKLRDELVLGGAVLGQPRRMLVGVVLPELGSYIAKLGVIAVFLGAYGIPVSFHNVVSVTASNSISNSVSVTPGGAGVTQAANTAALRNSTSAEDATAYSVSQQLITSAWNVVFAMILVAWVFGWSSGKQLVRSSYEKAKERTRGPPKGRGVPADTSP